MPHVLALWDPQTFAIVFLACCYGVGQVAVMVINALRGKVDPAVVNNALAGLADSHNDLRQQLLTVAQNQLPPAAVQALLVPVRAPPPAATFAVVHAETLQSPGPVPCGGKGEPIP